ncbi:hypothetical protein E2C01_042166 [Portunus trituberculatus]|uniref:Uncharacterized protein n=1 Tax=Portunus trituberculatus TaxID=210409 RepID=A0A5B7FSW4_PORTR|nr:hypothetical protein [Portunus trituberculatus]
MVKDTAFRQCSICPQLFCLPQQIGHPASDASGLISNSRTSTSPALDSPCKQQLRGYCTVTECCEEITLVSHKTPTGGREEVALLTVVILSRKQTRKASR